MSRFLLLTVLCALSAQAQDTAKDPYTLAAEATTKGKDILSACPAGDYQCADGSGCCPTGTLCGTGSASDLCLTLPTCPTGNFACSDGSGCCPYGRTCGTGSQSDKCLSSPAASSSSSLPSWAISLIVTIPLACLAAACRYHVQRSAKPADNYVTINPAAQAQPTYQGPPPTYQGPPPTYQGPPPTFMTTAPPANQGGQQWK